LLQITSIKKLFMAVSRVQGNLGLIDTAETIGGMQDDLGRHSGSIRGIVPVRLGDGQILGCSLWGRGGEAMNYDEWEGMGETERIKHRDLSCLSPQLSGLEGRRVEVVTMQGEKKRFIVGRSTGWRPVHLEVPRRDSTGGPAASREYKSVRRLYKR
jgi:hypothetical protein